MKESFQHAYFMLAVTVAALSLLLPGPVTGQPGQPLGATLAGEWAGAPAPVVITQDGDRVSGAWKERLTAICRTRQTE